MPAWLQTRQRHFMRPDAARYLQPDRARFLAPERKWDGQPRIEEGEEGAGQYRFGKQDEAGAPGRPATNSDGQPRVYIDRTLSPGDSEEGEGASNDLDNIFLASATKPGFGHNGGPPLGDPPEVPGERPSNSADRTSFVRAAASWIGSALGTGAFVAASAYIGILNNVDWLAGYNAAMTSNRDPPKTLDELRSGVGQSRPGYEDHHIMERTAAERWGLSRTKSTISPTLSVFLN